MYDIIYNKIKEDSVMGEINLKEINWILGACFHVPKEQRREVVKELINAGLIRRKNGWNVYAVMGEK